MFCSPNVTRYEHSGQIGAEKPIRMRFLVGTPRFSNPAFRGFERRRDEEFQPLTPQENISTLMVAARHYAAGLLFGLCHTGDRR